MDHFILGSRYYFIRLSEFDKKVYREIYDCWVGGGSVAEIKLPGSGFDLPSGKTLHEIVTFIIEENPHLFHLETSHFNYHRIGDRVTIKAKNVYSPDEYQAIYKRLIDRVGQITEKARKLQSEYDKLRFLHDYLAENITYDYGAPDAKSQREIHTIVGSLLNSACVCDGYARAFRLLCDQLHLSCIVAVGDSIQKGTEGPHAWNFVKVNGQVYHVDVTWDSNMISCGNPVTDYYFLRNDAVFSKDHFWDSSLYPPIIKDYDRKESMVSSKGELERCLCNKAKAKEREFLVCFDDSFPGEKVLRDLIQKIVKRNPSVFACVDKYSYIYYDDIKYAQFKYIW